MDWRWLLMAVGMAGLTGCAGVPTCTQALAPPLDSRAVVLVVDGAGANTAVQRTLQRTVAEQGLPLYVEGFPWSYGAGRFIADETDVEHSRAAGCRLAQRVRCLQQQINNLPVVVVGHSAGVAVVLACAEVLPPDSLERVVLLAPAVSAHYDLRPALIASRQGIDSFCSERDWFYLGVGTNWLGTADGKTDTAAGRTGFTPPPAQAADACLYAKFREHRWDPSVAWTGNGGEHSGTYKPIFLRTQIIPLLWPVASR
jgi:pimeloyl-ACP methyl ester carboxylesterase